jgi:hypothetical protein
VESGTAADALDADGAARVLAEATRAAAALGRMVLSNEFQEATSRRGHTKEFEVLTVLPGDEQPILREAARCIEHAVFGAKDGEDRRGLDAHHGPYEPGTAFVLCLDQRGDATMPMGSMRLNRPAGRGLASVNDIAGPPWFQDPLQMMRDTLVPLTDVVAKDFNDGLAVMPLPDLRAHPHTLDIVTLGVLPAYRRPSSTGGVRIAHMMYSALCREVTGPANIEYWVTIFDRPAHRIIQEEFGAPFRYYALEELVSEDQRRLKRLPYYAAYDSLTKRHSNSSRPVFADVATWYVTLKRNLPAQYDLLWEGALDHVVQFTTLGNIEAFRGGAASGRWTGARRLLGELDPRPVAGGEPLGGHGK